ncbi:MAG: M1 family metallopeptidase [Theionarchaea archaeon]|nr:M1 family metallopeptidase [Theionarchaea archaeon]
MIVSISMGLLLGCISQPPDTRTLSEEEIVSSFLETSWDDFTWFREGLVTSEQGTLDTLKGASIYHIDIHISDDYLMLMGHEEVAYTNREDEPLHDMYFRLFPNCTGGIISVSNLTVDSIECSPVYVYEDTAIQIILPEILLPQERIFIAMDFKLYLPQEMGGNYGLLGYFNDILVCDACYPVIPVYDDEQWNVESPPLHGDATYLDASFYMVRITSPKEAHIVTSGIEIGRIEGDTEQTLAVVAGPARDFYLAASEKFMVLSETMGETTINCYTLPDHFESAELALQIGIDAIQSFNGYIGQYPYTEYDIVSTPMLAKGMEYPGIVAISLALYDPEAVISGLPSRVLLESVIAHETAHQWIYNVVGNDQVDEPWLDEATVQYLTFVYYLNVHGARSATEYATSWQGLWDQIESREIPIGLPSSSYAPDEYTPIIYGRGPLFVRALAKEMGQDSFDTFFREYYTRHKWGICTAEEFLKLAESTCNCDLSKFYGEWIYT